MAALRQRMLIEQPALLEAAAAISQKDPWLERLAIRTIVDQLAEQAGGWASFRLEMGLVSVHTLGRGVKSDISRIVSAVERDTSTSLESRARV